MILCRRSSALGGEGSTCRSRTRRRSWGSRAGRSACGERRATTAGAVPGGDCAVAGAVTVASRRAASTAETRRTCAQPSGSQRGCPASFRFAASDVANRCGCWRCRFGEVAVVEVDAEGRFDATTTRHVPVSGAFTDALSEMVLERLIWHAARPQVIAMDSRLHSPLQGAGRSQSAQRVNRLVRPLAQMFLFCS